MRSPSKCSSVAFPLFCTPNDKQKRHFLTFRQNRAVKMPLDFRFRIQIFIYGNAAHSLCNTVLCLIS